MKLVVRHIKTNCLYGWMGGDEYKNLKSGVRGIVKPEMASKIFRIHLDATELMNENLEKLISELKLKIEPK